MRIPFAISVMALPWLALAQSAPVAANATAKARPVYQSSFAAFRAFKDEPVGIWRDLNETVRKAGGWSVYAREASQAAPMQDMSHAGTAK